MSLTQKRLKELLRYDPETGDFIWLVKIGGRDRRGERAGTLNDSGYRIIRVDGYGYRASHLAWLYVKGRLPSDEMDHRDCDPGNDVFRNLRPATSAENKWNTRISKNHSGRFKGAYFHKLTGKWRAQIMRYGKLHYLGLFLTEEQAHQAYREKADELFGEFARAA